MICWRRVILMVLVLFCTFRAVSAADPTRTVTRDQAATVCARWLEAMVSHHGDWAGDIAPSVRAVAPLDRAGVRVGWFCAVAPEGYVIVPARRELSPIKASSVRGTVSAAAAGGLSAFVLDDLLDRVSHLDRAAGNISPEHPAWARYLDMAKSEIGVLDETGPLLATRWTQGWPYNASCPMGDGGRAFVGCTALAAAQLMRYHAWPDHGRGDGAYWWPGDDGCGGASPGDTLRAVYGDAYDWGAMAEVVDGGSTAQSLEAVAELCYEVAVACRMDFSVCGSAASLSRMLWALVNRFRFGAEARERQRFRLSDAAWFDLIRDNVNRGLPLLYSSMIHTMVCDGWREIDGMQQVHINYGWGGDSDGWYALDGIETSMNPSAERMICDLAPDDTTPILLDSFGAVRHEGRARLTWRVGAAAEVEGLHVWRERVDGGRLRLTTHSLCISSEMQYTDPSPPSGETDYWLEEVPAQAGTVWHGPARLPSAGTRPVIVLSAPSPNPCNPLTNIQLTLSRPQYVRATVHDERGRLTSVLAEGPRPAGSISLTWDGTTSSGRSAASGVYLVRVSAGDHVLTRKVMLAR